MSPANRGPRRGNRERRSPSHQSSTARWGAGDAGGLSRARRLLLRWYDDNRRVLPWRQTRDAYAIWVSEIMAQQTRIETVVPRYEAFLAQFPDVLALSRAPVTEVCEAWAGLGYYRRARNLHAAARQLVRERNGVFPEDLPGLLALPGVGRYTAGAIASIAFGVEAPVVDGNVARVLARLYAMEDAIDSTVGRKKLWAWATDLVRGERPGDLNQAVMELGALVCTPRSPKCSSCPLQSGCPAEARGKPEVFPNRPGPSPRKPLRLAFAWLPTPTGLWLERRALDGLWAGLWEPPSAGGPQAKRELAERLGVELLRPLARVNHQLSHLDVDARVYPAREAPRLRQSRDRQRCADPLAAPLSVLAKKAVRAALATGASIRFRDG